MFRLHAAMQLRLGQAELITRLIAGLALLAFLTQALFNRSLVALFLACSFVLLYAQRSARIAWARYQHETGTSRARLLLVGEPARRINELVRAASAAPDPPNFIGYLRPNASPLSAAGELTCVEQLSDLPRLPHEQTIDHVMFFPPTHQPEQVRAELHACEEVGVTASFSVDLVQLSEATPTLTEHFEHAFVSFEVAPKPKGALALEYALDPVLAAF
jgi:FlaA1/EpsC-like NDP-sugar epimerase